MIKLFKQLLLINEVINIIQHMKLKTKKRKLRKSLYSTLNNMVNIIESASTHKLNRLFMLKSTFTYNQNIFITILVIKKQ